MDNVGTHLWTGSLFGDKIAKKKYQRPVHRLRRDRLQLSVSVVCLSYRKLKGLCMMSPWFCCFKSILWVCHYWVLLLMHKMLCYRYEEDIKHMSPWGRSNHKGTRKVFFMFALFQSPRTLVPGFNSLSTIWTPRSTILSERLVMAKLDKVGPVSIQVHPCHLLQQKTVKCFYA